MSATLLHVIWAFLDRGKLNIFKVYSSGSLRYLCWRCVPSSPAGGSTSQPQDEKEASQLPASSSSWRASQSYCCNGKANFVVSEICYVMPHCRSRVWGSSGEIWLVRGISGATRCVCYLEPRFNVEMQMLTPVTATSCDPVCSGWTYEKDQATKYLNEYNTFYKRAHCMCC